MSGRARSLYIKISAFHSLYLFDTEDANVFLNGVASTLSAVKSAQQQAGFAVLYYNVRVKDDLGLYHHGLGQR